MKEWTRLAHPWQASINRYQVPQDLVTLPVFQFRRKGHVLHPRVTGVADQLCLEKTSLALYRNEVTHSY